MTGDMRHALNERRELIEARADAVFDTARQAGEPWTKPLGQPPRDPRKTAAWRRHARTIAAYRDRHGITDDTPLGPTPENAAQKIDRARAEAALRQLASQPEPHRQHRPPAPTPAGAKPVEGVLDSRSVSGLASTARSASMVTCCSSDTGVSLRAPQAEGEKDMRRPCRQAAAMNGGVSDD